MVKYKAIIQNLRTPDGKTIQTFCATQQIAEDWANKQIEAHPYDKLVVEIYELVYNHVTTIISEQSAH